MSPRASWAKWVMPMRTDPSASPGTRTHSCSLVYFSSSGYTVTPSPRGSWCWSCSRLLVLARLGVARGISVDDRVDAHLVAHPVDRAGGEVQRAGQRGRLPDHVDDVRRVEYLAIDGQAGAGVLDRGLGDHPDPVVELHRLGAGGPELLDDVEQGVVLDLAAVVGDGDPHARPDGRHRAGQDAQRGRLLPGLLQGGLAARRRGAEVVAGLAQPVDLVLGALRGAGQAVENADQVGLAQRRVGVVALVGLHL